MLYHHLLKKYLAQLVVQKFLVMLELPNLLGMLLTAYGTSTIDRSTPVCN
jgi:hypothetical protein